jgi:hypothetical protein
VIEKRSPAAGDDGASEASRIVGGNPYIAASPKRFKLAIEHTTTADMDDGQPLPPFMEDGVLWCVVRRQHSRTLWRRITLQTAEQSAAVTHRGGLNLRKRRNGD